MPPQLSMTLEINLLVGPCQILQWGQQVAARQEQPRADPLSVLVTAKLLSGCAPVSPHAVSVGSPPLGRGDTGQAPASPEELVCGSQLAAAVAALAGPLAACLPGRAAGGHGQAAVSV